MCSKLHCCYLYLKTQATLDSFFLLKCNLHSIFYGGGSERAHGEVLRGPAGLRVAMSVQLQLRTPSIDPAVENYFCNAVHLACEVSDTPRDACTVAR